MQRAKVKNEIVLMRNVVKRVKVQVIRQMTRQIKKLRAKKGTEQQMEKNSRRIQRLLAELESIKDLVADDVSRQAFFGKLSFDMKSQEDDTLKRATNRIVQHKIIQERVASLKDQGILTSNLNLKELDKKRRRKNKKLPMDCKDEGDNDNMVDTLNDKDNDDTDDNDESSDDVDNSESEDEHENSDQKVLKDPTIKLIKPKVDHEMNDSGKNMVSDFFIRGSSDDDDDDINVEKLDNDADEDVPPQKRTKNSKLMERTKKNRNVDKEQNKLKCMRGRREQLEENTRTAFRKRAAEAKAALVDRPNSTTVPTDNEKNILGISDLPPGLDSFNDKNIEGSIHGMKRQFPKHTSNSSSVGPRMSNKKSQKDLSNEKLHPSWEAKRKQKEKTKTIVPFQGTKITFDD